ncbi:uncharacterized protein LOC124872438 [Girardinichthys multiradiatus]|uniref:uncharacterized protein LOC124872438 n=1 Tax=Girardinichthys multiradiatus TaxID=208333 RepID=UPI001FABF6E8|nr:uncharacterized protein LOC124872438 [Girardinichthys multiradiatus]
MTIPNFLASASVSQIATYATIIVIFTYNVLFEINVGCTCKDQKTHCWFYILVPVFLITFLLLWTDKIFKRTCSYCCTYQFTCNRDMMRNFCCVCKVRKLCSTAFPQIIKAGFIGALWIVSVLIDGEWYACCQNGLSGPEAQIPCKKKSNRTLEEQTLVDGLNNDSKVAGFLVLLVILILAGFRSSIDWRKCCEKTCTCCDRVALYELVILEQKEEILKDIWMKKAKEDLNIKIENILNRQDQNETVNRSKYAACCDAANTLIEELEQQSNQVQGIPLSEVPAERQQLNAGQGGE